MVRVIQGSYSGTVWSWQTVSSKRDGVYILEHWIILIRTVGAETEARVVGEVLAEIVNGEIADVELDPISPVLRHLCCVHQRHSHRSFDEDSISCSTFQA